MTLARWQGFPGCHPSGCEGRVAGPVPGTPSEPPLRRTTDPYASRVAEVTLEQTRDPDTLLDHAYVVMATVRLRVATGGGVDD